MNDGIDDGQAVNLTSLDAIVQDYPHNGAGELCVNVGFVENRNAFNGITPDTMMQVVYYDYEDRRSLLTFESFIPLPPPFIEASTIALTRSVNVITIHRESADSTPLFGAPIENTVAFTMNIGFEAGWMNFVMADYDYDSNLSMEALTEPTGGLGSGVNNRWTGVPIIGFAAISSEIQTGHLGETIELIRKVNRQ